MFIFYCQECDKFWVLSEVRGEPPDLVQCSGCGSECFQFSVMDVLITVAKAVAEQESAI